MIYRYLMTNGAVVDIVSVNPLSLDQLQGLVGGLIEFAHGHRIKGDGITKEMSACCNEEGTILNLDVNPHVSQYYGDEIIPIHGNVVLGMDTQDEEGEIQFSGIDLKKIEELNE